MASVFFGVLSTIAAALLLFPIVKLIMNRYFHLYLFSLRPPDAWRDDLIMEITFYIWAAISTTSGGFVSTLVAQKKELRNVTFTIATIFIIANILTKGNLFEWDRMAIVMQLLNPIGFLIGWLIAMRFKQRTRIIS